MTEQFACLWASISISEALLALPPLCCVASGSWSNFSEPCSLLCKRGGTVTAPELFRDLEEEAASGSASRWLLGRLGALAPPSQGELGDEMRSWVLVHFYIGFPLGGGGGRRAVPQLKKFSGPSCWVLGSLVTLSLLLTPNLQRPGAASRLKLNHRRRGSRG